MEKENWKGFLKLCLSAKTEKQLDALFDLFLTPEEKSSITTRHAIVHELLAEKKPQRQIAAELAVSIAKITRGSNELKRISPKLRGFLKENG